jgi:putative transposase
MSFREGCFQEQVCLSCRFQVIITNSTRSHALHDYLVHYHAERNHQGKGNVLLFPTATQAKNRVDGSVRCKERLGGLLKYYHREAA